MGWSKENGKWFYRNNWIEFHPQFHSFALTYSIAGYFDVRNKIHICFGWGNLFLSLPWPFISGISDYEAPRYGIKYFDSTLVMHFGNFRKYIYMPWTYERYRESYLRKDGKWEHSSRGKNCKEFWKDEWKSVLYEQSWPYKYYLRSTKIQHRIATIRVNENEYRPKWFGWFPPFRRVRKYIDVSFNDEVGERSGSWKGGTIGCSYEMRPDDTPAMTLFRMERERKF